MSGSQSQPTQTTNTVAQMSPEQKQLYDLALPGIKSFAATVPQRYQGDTVAGFTAPQTAGQANVLSAVPGQTQLANAAAGANSNLLTNIWDPSTNPNLKGAIDAATQPIKDAYTSQVLPGIRDEFSTSQPFGGSRRGVADVNAQNTYERNLGQAGATVAQNEYNTNIDAQLKALGLTPTTQGALAQPGVTQSGVGDVQQNQAQQVLNSNVAGFNYDELAPFLQSQEIASLIGGIPGGSSTSTSTGNTPTANPLTQGLGGAVSGATLGSLLFPGVGTAAGAGIGALLPFLH